MLTYDEALEVLRKDLARCPLVGVTDYAVGDETHYFFGYIDLEHPWDGNPENMIAGGPMGYLVAKTDGEIISVSSSPGDRHFHKVMAMPERYGNMPPDFDDEPEEDDIEAWVTITPDT